jgi:Dolichyl-phosphate-mannose-protein mannosyltransferase
MPNARNQFAGRFLLSFLLTLLAGLLIVSATGKFSSAWPSLWVVAPEIRDSLLLSIFCGILFLKVCIGPHSPQQWTPSFALKPKLGIKLLNPYLIFLSLTLSLLYIYFRTLNVFIIYDDLYYLKIITDIGENPSLLFRYFERPVEGIWYRPLLVVTYLHDYLLWGTNYVGWRITSLGLYLANAWLVYCLTRHITREGWVAFLAGVIFAIHPIHPEAVAYIAGRHDPLAAFFYLAAFLSFILFCQSRSKAYGALSVFCFIFAFMSKEVAITLPLVLIAYTLILTKSEDERIRTRGFGLIVLHVFTLVIYLVFRLVAVGDVGGYRDAAGTPLVFRPDPLIALFSFIITPVRHFLFPFNQAIPDVRLVRPGLAVILGASLLLLIRRAHLLRRGSARFGLIFLCVSVLPMYHLLYISPQLNNSRYLYFPTIPLSMLAAEFLMTGVEHLKRWKRNTLLVGVIGGCAALCLLTLLNNTYWRRLGTVASNLPATLHGMYPQLKPGVRLYIYGAPVAWNNQVLYGPYLDEAIRLFYGHRDFKVYDAAWEASFYKDSFRGLPDPESLHPGERDLIFWYDQESRQLYDVSTKLRELLSRPPVQKETQWAFRKENAEQSGKGGAENTERREASILYGGNHAVLIDLPIEWIPSTQDVFEICMKSEPPTRNAAGEMAYSEMSWWAVDAPFTQDRAARIPIRTDSHWHTYSAAIGRYVPWLLTSKVAHIRFKPLPFPAQHEIGWVRLRTDGEEFDSSSSDPCMPSKLARHAPTSRDAPHKVAASYRLLRLNPGPSLSADEFLTLHLSALNTGEAIWLARAEDEKGAVRLGWRWFKGEQEIPNTQGRERLGYDVLPKQWYEFQARISPPVEAGEYTLELGLVSEFLTWFIDQGSRSLRIPVTVHTPSERH